MVYLCSGCAVVCDVYIAFICVVSDTRDGDTNAGCEVHIGDGFASAFGDFISCSVITCVGSSVDEAAVVGDVAFVMRGEVHF